MCARASKGLLCVGACAAVVSTALLRRPYQQLDSTSWVLVFCFFFNAGALSVSAQMHARSHTDSSSGGGNIASTLFLSVSACVRVCVH